MIPGGNHGGCVAVAVAEVVVVEVVAVVVVVVATVKAFAALSGAVSTQGSKGQGANSRRNG